MNTEIHARNANIGTDLYALTKMFPSLVTVRNHHVNCTCGFIEADIPRDEGGRTMDNIDFNDIVNELNAALEKYGAEYISGRFRKDSKTITITIEDSNADK